MLQRQHKLKQKLDEKGLKLCWLAGKAQIPLNTIYKVSAGYQVPSTDIQKRISTILSIPSDELFI